MVRKYEFYLRVVKTIFHERAQRVHKILFSPRENKIHTFKPPCNVLFIDVLFIDSVINALGLFDT